MGAATERLADVVDVSANIEAFAAEDAEIDFLGPITVETSSYNFLFLFSFGDSGYGKLVEMARQELGADGVNLDVEALVILNLPPDTLCEDVNLNPVTLTVESGSARFLDATNKSEIFKPLELEQYFAAPAPGPQAAPPTAPKRWRRWPWPPTSGSGRRSSGTASRPLRA